MSLRMVAGVAVCLNALCTGLLLTEEAEIPFSLSKETQGLMPVFKTAVVNELRTQFGDAAHPKIPEGIPVEESAIEGRAIFAKSCARCHGAAGDGAGTESPKLDPKPRDFRIGVFKWKSTRPGEWATRHDLSETIRVGIPGTAMPAFADLSERDRKSVVEYVRWLSIVGSLQSRLGVEFRDYSNAERSNRLAKGEKRKAIAEAAQEALETEFPQSVKECLEYLSERWTNAESAEQTVSPQQKPERSTPESVERGRLLFLSPKTKCNSCHGDTGKGDGPATRERWPKPGTAARYTNVGLHDAWGNLNQPWDLTADPFRGGDADEDLYRRIAAGIAGTTMPGYGGTLLKDDEICDLLNFVKSLRPETDRHDGVQRRPRPAIKQ